jgi:5-methylcytosine-specific restriction enzyme A
VTKPKIASLTPKVSMVGGNGGTTLGVGWSDSRRGSRQERGYGSEWDRLRLTILKRDQYVCKCADCATLNRIRPATQVDHIRNKEQGGSDDPSNLQAINVVCHKIKTAREAKAARGGGVGAR